LRRLGYFVVREAIMVTLKHQLEDDKSEHLAHIFQEDVQQITSGIDSAESEDIDSDNKRDAALDKLEDGLEDLTASSTTLHNSDNVNKFLVSRYGPAGGAPRSAAGCRTTGGAWSLVRGDGA
jgi:hypothetical protein